MALVKQMLYSLLRAFMVLIVRLVVSSMGGVRTEGAENVPKTGGLIVAPNHLSYADGPLVGAFLPRPAAFMATSELFSFRGWGWVARAMKAFPVEQDAADLSAIRKAVEILKAGEALVIFPEGHMSLTGRLQPLRPGVISIALHAEAPILPVWIEGTDLLMPPRQTKMRRVSRPILIRFGKAITPQELAGGRRGRAAVDYGAELLYRRLQELSQKGGSSLRETREQGSEHGGGPHVP